jgi:hypothetical protein
MTIAPNDAAPKQLTVTVAAAKQISGLGLTTLWGLIKTEKLEAVRVGRRTLVTVRSLEALLTPTAEPQSRRRGRPRKSADTSAVS